MGTKKNAMATKTKTTSLPTDEPDSVKPFLGSDDPELRAQAERMSHRELFDLRVRREGRRDEFDRIVKELTASGKTVQAAYRMASESLGRRSLKEEQQLYINHLASEAYVARRRELAERQAVIRRRRADLAYENALRSLPPVASPSAELDWVRAHPAMSVLSRSTLKGKPRKVLVKEKDILHPPHGSAPSQAAVNMLQNWCNRPDEFFAKMLMEQRKGGSSGSGRGRPPEIHETSADDPADDTSELDALLGAH